jgi:hypothetical protein
MTLEERAEEALPDMRVRQVIIYKEEEVHDAISPALIAKLSTAVFGIK